MRCSVCSNPQVTEVDVLLGSGSSVRQVARMYAIPRTTLARHAEHTTPTSTPFGLIRGEGGPSGPADPLAEAYVLAERARTARERLKALEAIRAATALKLRALGGRPDADDRELLERNIRDAEAAYRDGSGSFEHATRALQGLREAIRQALDAAKVAPDAIDVPLRVTHADGRVVSDGTVVQTSPAVYWAGVPSRFHDPSRYVVHRVIDLSFTSTKPGEKVRVYEVATGALAWAR